MPFPPPKLWCRLLGSGGAEGGGFYHSREVPVNPSGRFFSSWFLQLEVFNQPSKEVFQGNVTKERAGLSSDCSLCGLCLSSGRHAVAFRRGMGLFQAEVSNQDPKSGLFKAIRWKCAVGAFLVAYPLISVLLSRPNLVVFLLRHKN